MRKFKIDQAIFEQFPEAHVGVLVVKKLKNDQVSEGVQFILRESESMVVENHTGKAITDLPEIKEWRQAYRKFGAKKNRRVSIEAIIKRTLKGDSLPMINPLVDLYNAVSLRYIFPCGGEDLDAVKGDIQLTIAKGDEAFMTIGSEVNDPPAPGEIVYKDDMGCLCRCWNWREADRTKLTAHTREAVLVIETLDQQRKNELEEALKHLEGLTKRLLGADTRLEILHKECPEMVF